MNAGDELHFPALVLRDKPPAAETVGELARKARNQSDRLRTQGKLAPLGVDPATGKRLRNTGRYPKTGLHSPILPAVSSAPVVNQEWRFRSRRERANELRERMASFSSIFNAGYMVRDAYFGPSERQRDAVIRMLQVLIAELRQTTDFEALLFAVADSLYASKLGVPWEV